MLTPEMMTPELYDALVHSGIDPDDEDFLAHHGVKGMKWGIRRDPETGIRPIAQALNNSAFGRLSKKNVERHNRAMSKKSVNRLQKETRDPLGERLKNGAKEVFGNSIYANELKPHQQVAQSVAGAGIGVGLAALAMKGSSFLASNPQYMARAANTMRGTKAIDMGYTVVKMTLKNGRYVLP